MCKVFKDNFRAKYRTLARGEEDMDPGLQCEDCGQSGDSQSHCLVCPTWAQDRDGLDLTVIDDMLTYFQRVLQGREDKRKDIMNRRRDG